MTQPTMPLADQWLTRPVPKTAKPRTPRRPQPAPVPATTLPRVTVDAGPPRSWRLWFAAPEKIATSNTGKHWRTSSGIRGGWRDAMVTLLRHAKLPTGLRRVRVDIELRFPTGGRRDASNYHPLVGKPLVDALSPPRIRRITKGKRAGATDVDPGYGLILDDEPKKYLHCEDCPHLRVSDVRGRPPYGEVVVTITDLSEEDL